MARILNYFLYFVYFTATTIFTQHTADGNIYRKVNVKKM